MFLFLTKLSITYYLMYAMAKSRYMVQNSSTPSKLYQLVVADTAGIWPAIICCEFSSVLHTMYVCSSRVDEFEQKAF